MPGGENELWEKDRCQYDTFGTSGSGLPAAYGSWQP